MITLLGVAALAAAGLPPCELPDLSGPIEPSAHRMLDLGRGRLGVALEDPMGEPGTYLPARPREAPPGPAPEGQRWLWSVASGWLPVPKGWELRRAAVGVNGSWVIELSAPEGQPGRFRAMDTGACVGCALSAGAPHFERYRALAADNEFLYCEGLDRQIRETGRGEAWREFRYLDASGRRVELRVEIDPEGAGYREVAITRD